MPALPSPGAIIKAGYRFGLATGEPLGQVALHFAYTGGPPVVADVAALATSMLASADTHFKPLQSNVVSGQDFVVTDLSSPTGAVGTASGSTFAGTRSGQPTPDEVAVNTLYEVSRRYRGGRPRSYWPFGTGADYLTQRNWSSALVADVEAGVQAFIADCLTFSHGGVALSEWVNVSYYEGFTNFTEPSGRMRVIPSLRTTPVVDALTFGYCNNIISSQKRRRGKPV